MTRLYQGDAYPCAHAAVALGESLLRDRNIICLQRLRERDGCRHNSAVAASMVLIGQYTGDKLGRAVVPRSKIVPGASRTSLPILDFCTRLWALVDRGLVRRRYGFAIEPFVISATAGLYFVQWQSPLLGVQGPEV